MKILLRRGIFAAGGLAAGIGIKKGFCNTGLHHVNDIYIPEDVTPRELKDIDLVYRPPFPINPENGQIFFDIGKDGKFIGRVEIETFDDCAPMLSLNMKALSTGSFMGFPITFKHATKHRAMGDQKLMSYTNTLIHKVVRGMYIQGGDNVYYDGKGGESFSGDLLQDCFTDKSGKIPGPGCVCMVNAFRHGNASQFIITYRAFPHLERRNSCVGQVVKGWGVLEEIEKVSTSSGVPKYELSILQCGIIKHKSGSLFDPRDPIAVPPNFKWTECGSVNLTTHTSKVDLMSNAIAKYESQLSSFDNRGGDGTGSKNVMPMKDLARDLTGPGGF